MKKASSHMFEGVSVAHICAICYTANDKPHPHPAKKCNNLRSKEGHTQDRNTAYQPNKQYKGKKGRTPAREREYDTESKN